MTVRQSELDLAPLLGRMSNTLDDARDTLLAHEGVIIDALARQNLDGALARDLQHIDLVSQVMADLSRLLGAIAGSGLETRLEAQALMPSLRLEKLRRDLLGEADATAIRSPVELF